MQESILIQEVMPRDGLQNEPKFMETSDKIELINRLSRTGVSKIEVTSFVSPKAIPNLKDAEQVMSRIKREKGVTYTALVPNKKGAERALACAVDEINLVVSVSETHNRQNVRRSVRQSLDEFQSVIAFVKAEGVKVNGSLGTAFGCPFEGAISEKAVFQVIETYLAHGVDSITLADTTGMANPRQVFELCSKVKDEFPSLPLTLHFHNTRGMGLANILAGIRAGVKRYDSSLGGLGGCPFAPGASGNVCTEDVVHMLQSMGYDVRVDLDQLLSIADQLQRIVGHPLPSSILKAGKSTDLYPVPTDNV